MTTNTIVAEEVKTVAYEAGEQANQILATITKVNIARNSSGDILYNIGLDTNVPTIDGRTKNYIWVAASRLRYDLVRCNDDFDIIIAANKERAVMANETEWLPLSLAQAKLYLVGANIVIEHEFISAGEVRVYRDTDYTYEHDTIIYDIVGIELTAKAQARLDRKIDSLL